MARLRQFRCRVAAETAFDLLHADRVAIEADFGSALRWERLDAKAGSRVAVYRNDLDPNDECQWPQQFAWLVEQMEGFARVFPERIRTLPLDAVIDTEAVAPPASAADG